MSARPTLILATLVSMILAGCASGGSDDAGAAGDAPLAPAGASEDTGRVEGLVTDDEALPIIGAQVALLPAALETLTDEGGRFALEGVPPGTHTVAAQKLGYESRAISVDVAAGEVAQVSIELVALRAAAPYVQVDSYSGHLDWGVRVEPVVGGIASGDIVHTWETDEAPENLNQMFIEMVWEDTQPLAGGMRLRVEVQGEANDLDWTFCVLDGVSPLTCAVERGTIEDIITGGHSRCDEEECDIQWRGFTATHNTNLPVDFGVMVDQDFTVWVSHFYFHDLPPNYSARPDA